MSIALIVVIVVAVVVVIAVLAVMARRRNAEREIEHDPPLRTRRTRTATRPTQRLPRT